MRSAGIAAIEEMSGRFMPTFFPVLVAPSPLPNLLSSGAALLANIHRKRDHGGSRAGP